MENLWSKKDWDLRELLRSAENIKELFRIYWDNRQYISENRPELARFVLRVFWHRFCRVPNFRFLILANEATYGLPDSDPVRWEIKRTFLDQIRINY